MKKLSPTIAGMHLTGATLFNFNAYAALQPPVSWNFSEEQEGLSVINTEDGSRTFEWSRWDKYEYEGDYGDTADDWLVLPALELKEGTLYEVSFDARAYWNRFEWNPVLKWMIGAAPDAESLSEQISSTDSFKSDYYAQTFSFTFSVQENGTYYLGARLTADEAQGYPEFAFEKISISEGISLSAPSAPHLSAVPEIRDGGIAVELTLTAPVSDLSGEKLSGELTYSITSVDGRFRATGPIVPGATVSLSDADISAKSETYQACVYYKDSESSPTSEITVSLEYDEPKSVENIRVSRDGSIVSISWDPVTEGKNGGLFDPSKVVYSVNRNDRTNVCSKISGTSVSDNPEFPEHGQKELSYTVLAYADQSAFRSSDSASAPIMIGYPYCMEFKESFAGRDVSTNGWSSEPAGESAAWSPSSGSYSNPYCTQAQDNDGGFLLYNPSSYSRATDYLSPLINMSGATNPVIEFYIYTYTTAPEEALASVGLYKAGKRYELPGGDICFHGDTDGWQKIAIAIPAELYDEDFRIVFCGKASSYTNKAIIDNIMVRDVHERNIKVKDVSSRSTAMPGETLKVSVTIENNGASDLDEVWISLSEGACTYESPEPVAIASGATCVMDFDVLITPFMANSDVILTAEAYIENDGLEADNTMTSVISVGGHDLPHISDLSATHSNDGPVLTWTLPVFDETVTSSEIMESFEEWETGSTEASCGWIFIDADGGEKNGLAYENQYGTYAFFVAEELSTSSVASIYPAEGQKVLVTTRNSDYSATDSWLISPVFDPSRPVSFQAAGLGFRSYESVSFEIGYLPSGSVDIADFKKIRDAETDYYGWTSLIIEDFPREAARFVIHTSDVQSNAIAFDDFRFHAIAERPEIRCHNIWRNGLFVASTDADAITFSDKDADTSKANIYHVSTVYEPGKEVIHPEGYELLPGSGTGIADNVATPLFTVIGNTLEAHTEILIYSADGSAVSRVETGSRIVLPAGIYIISGNGTITKVLIK